MVSIFRIREPQCRHKRNNLVAYRRATWYKGLLAVAMTLLVESLAWYHWVRCSTLDWHIDFPGGRRCRQSWEYSFWGAICCSIWLPWTGPSPGMFQLSQRSGPQCGVICIGVLHAIPLRHIRDVDVEQYRGENGALWFVIAEFLFLLRRRLRFREQTFDLGILKTGKNETWKILKEGSSPTDIDTAYSANWHAHDKLFKKADTVIFLSPFFIRYVSFSIKIQRFFFGGIVVWNLSKEITYSAVGQLLNK